MVTGILVIVMIMTPLVMI